MIKAGTRGCVFIDNETHYREMSDTTGATYIRDLMVSEDAATACNSMLFVARLSPKATTHFKA